MSPRASPLKPADELVLEGRESEDGPKKQSANISSRLIDRVIPSSAAFAVVVPKSGGGLSSPPLIAAVPDELLLAPSMNRERSAG